MGWKGGFECLLEGALRGDKSGITLKCQRGLKGIGSNRPRSQAKGRGIGLAGQKEGIISQG